MSGLPGERPAADPGDRRRDAPPGRAAELARNLAATRARIAAACAAAGRDPGRVTLIAVTKTYPAADVLALAGLGLTDFGENRDQEAAPKARAVDPPPGARPVTWHFIGQLQTNKAAQRGQVRRLRALGGPGPAGAGASAAAARAAGRDLTCLVQVSLDPADAGPGLARDLAPGRADRRAAGPRRRAARPAR